MNGLVGLVAFSCAALVWAVSQSRSVSGEREQNAILRDRLAGHFQKEQDSSLHLPEGAMDWRSLSGKVGNRAWGFQRTKTRLALSERFLGMGAEKIAAELDALNATDIGYNHKETFAWQAILVLAQKDPELALRRFARGFDNSAGVPLYPLAVALKNWARMDPVTAASWFDAEIAAGTFIGKDLSKGGGRQSVFEHELLTGLIDSNPAMASARLRAQGQQRAAEILGKIDTTQVSLAVYSEIVRGVLENPSDRIQRLAWAVRPYAERQGYADATSYMEGIHASAEERAATVEYVVDNKRITTEGELRVMREWVRQQSPDTLGKMTGLALARAAEPTSSGAKMSFDTAVGLVKSYDGNDVLAAFLYSHAARANRERSVEMAAGISDATVREKILEYLR